MCWFDKCWLSGLPSPMAKWPKTSLTVYKMITECFQHKIVWYSKVVQKMFLTVEKR